MTFQVALLNKRFVVIGSDSRQTNTHENRPSSTHIYDGVTKIIPVAKNAVVIGNGEFVMPKSAGIFTLERFLKDFTAGTQINISSIAETLSKFFEDQFQLHTRNAQSNVQYACHIIGFNGSGQLDFYGIEIPGIIKKIELQYSQLPSNNLGYFIGTGKIEAVSCCNAIVNTAVPMPPTLTEPNKLAKHNLSTKRYPTDTPPDPIEALANFLGNAIEETIETFRLYYGEPERAETTFTVENISNIPDIGGKPDIAIIDPNNGGFRWHIKKGRLVEEVTSALDSVFASYVKPF